MSNFNKFTNVQLNVCIILCNAPPLPPLLILLIFSKRVWVRRRKQYSISLGDINRPATQFSTFQETNITELQYKRNSISPDSKMRSGTRNKRSGGGTTVMVPSPPFPQRHTATIVLAHAICLPSPCMQARAFFSYFKDY